MTRYGETDRATVQAATSRLIRTKTVKISRMITNPKYIRALRWPFETVDSDERTVITRIMSHKTIGTTPETSKLLLYIFLKLNLWLCVLSVALVCITAYALGIPVASLGTAAVLPALLFYFIYVEDRRSVSPEDWSNQPVRTAVVTRYGTAFLCTELLALFSYQLLLVSYAFAGSLWLLVLGQVPFVVLAGYDHIKRIPGGDSLAVGGTWAYTGVFAVVVATGEPLSRSVVAAFLGWFLIVFAGAESRNVQDVTGDHGAEKTTLAGYLGPKRTASFETVLKLLGVLVFWLLSGPLAAAAVVCYLLALRAFRRLTRGADVLLAGWERAETAESAPELRTEAS